MWWWLWDDLSLRRKRLVINAGNVRTVWHVLPQQLSPVVCFVFALADGDALLDQRPTDFECVLVLITVF